MINHKNTQNFVDRNGLKLQYGDQVIAKIWSARFPYSACTVVGFTNYYVVVWVNDSETTQLRTPNNVVKVKDLKTWKRNF